MKNYFRAASPNERIYIEAQKLFSPLYIQCLFQGESSLDLNDLSQAVKKVTAVCPGARLIYKKGKWIDSQLCPEVCELHCGAFDGYNVDVLKLNERVVDISEKPPIEVILLRGKTTGLLFRIFHGIMDGQGALLFIKNVFKALRQDAVIGIDSPHNDLTLLKEIGYKRSHDMGFPTKKILANKESWVDYEKISTKRITIDGDYKCLVAKMIKVLTDSFIDDVSLFMVPVSLRKKKEDLLCTANLVLPIFIKSTKKLSVQDINTQLIEKIRNDEYLNMNNAGQGLLGHLPSPILNNVLSIYNFLCESLNVYSTSGTISYVGQYALEDFSCPLFTCQTFYSIPLCTPFSPVSVVAYKNDHAIEISISYYERIISGDMMDKIASEMVDEIRGTRVYKLLNETAKERDVTSLCASMTESFDKFSDRVAVNEAGREWTYKALDEESNRIKLALLKTLEPNQKNVFILMERSVDFVSAVVACIKSGLTFIPLDTNDFDGQSMALIESCDYPVLVNDTSSLLIGDKNNKININHIDINHIDLNDAFDYENDGLLNNDIVYRIYTSGTTGKPKGVNINNRNIVNYLLWAKDTYSMNTTNNFAFFTSTAVDLTITSYLLPLITGGTVHAYKEKLNPLILRDILNNDHINCFKMTPSHLRLINSLGLKLRKPLKNKVLILGGEQLKFSILSSSNAIFDETCLIVNEYGPTETTIGSLYNIVEDRHIEKGVVPIGKPIDNTEVLLLKEGLQVGQGEIGHLYIGGSGVSLGYTEEETNDSYVWHGGKRYYKSGDLAYLNEKNKYVFVSRQDQQIKINGRRVELESLESIVSEHHAVSDSIVRFDEKRRHLILYYISDVGMSDNDFINFLKGKVAEYALPAYFIKLESIPLLKTGKIDEKRLKEIYLEHGSRPTTIKNRVVLTKLQESIQRLYGKILNLENDRIDIEESFINLGGDSLGYIELTNEIIKSFIDEKDEKRMLNILNASYYTLSVRKTSIIIENYKKAIKSET
jgi:amino acid adenylation domain-containing protein